MRIGILGGTFDPVHNAHLAIAEEARNCLELSEVLFIPAGQPWMKIIKEISPSHHRVEMVRLAIRGVPYFKLSVMEVERKGPSYTVDTLAELKTQFGNASELYFIVGWDTIAQIPRWKEPVKMLTMCSLVVFPRPGFPFPDMESIDEKLPGLSKKTILLGKPEIDISATEIRERVARKQSISRLVPKKVAEYIREKGLYHG
jgi:nicotinate-nucleotide adenylyltransferase